jgi:hypothetical protein
MRHAGLFDALPFASRLTAAVIQPGPLPRIFGLSVGLDLAGEVPFHAQVWLSLTGELPTPDEAEAFSWALSLLSALHIGRCPTHAAGLARLAGASDAMLPAIAAVGLGQWGEAEQALFTAVGDWMAGRSGPPAAAIEPAPNDEVEASQERLSAATLRWFGPAGALPARPLLRPEAAAAWLLLGLGIQDAARLQIIALWARLPATLAEALCQRPGAVLQHPGRLPDYVYVEDR